MSKRVVVIGAGQAGFAFAEKYRALDDTAEITLIGDEPELPYQRPPLSKKYVTGELARERLFLRSADWFEKKRITCLTDSRVEQIDVPANTVVLANGDTYSWDTLALATGSRPRHLPTSIGGNLTNVFPIRSLTDADFFATVFRPGARLLIVGGGYIGLEAAAVATLQGMQVHVIEMADRILQRVACADTSDYFRALHKSRGVDIREGLGLAQLRGDAEGCVSSAELSDGRVLDVDAVLVGIGIEPNSALAEAAGIHSDNGIVVDAYGQTSQPGIYACGDCASFDYRGSRLRLESVQNAKDQAVNAAYNAAHSDAGSSADEPIAYAPVPWFWSDQFDVTLQIAGLNIGYDQTVHRPGTREGGQSIWYFRQGEFIAVDAMNDAKTYMFGRKLLEAGVPVAPTQAADPATDLKSLLHND